MNELVLIVKDGTSIDLLSAFEHVDSDNISHLKISLKNDGTKSLKELNKILTKENISALSVANKETGHILHMHNNYTRILDFLLSTTTHQSTFELHLIDNNEIEKDAVQR